MLADVLSFSALGALFWTASSEVSIEMQVFSVFLLLNSFGTWFTSLDARFLQRALAVFTSCGMGVYYELYKEMEQGELLVRYALMVTALANAGAAVKLVQSID